MPYNYEHHQTVTDKLANLQSQNKVLLRIIEEEIAANGGHLASPDSILWFEQAFCEFGESYKDALERLLSRRKGLTTQETRN